MPPIDAPRVEISVIVPVYGCRTCLEELHRRLSGTMSGLVPNYELLFVDDRSPDGAWTFLRDLARRDQRVRAIRLSRNFGQQVAITAGLAECVGNWAVVMDCDLQDPPEEIARLYQLALAGNEVVLARRKRKQHSLFRRLAARLFFRIIRCFNEGAHEGEFGSFSIVSRKAIDAFLSLQDHDRHYLFILQWIGFTTGEIEYEHGARHSGQSSYTLARLIRHAFDGVFFQTTSLLRWIVYLGFAVSGTGVALACYFLYQYLAHNVLPGFTSLAVLLLLIGGFIIISTGVTGLYIGKIFDQVKGRPLYIVETATGRAENE
jgi:polyisoprenyl-phosphate glycosyltransferase